MDADDDYSRAGVRPSPLAPLPDHRNVNAPWWQELWRRHAHITTPLRARGLTCDIEFGLSAYIVRVSLPDNTILIISPPQEPATERPPGDPEGWIATREHPADASLFEVVYDSSPSDDPGTPQRPEACHGGSAEPLIAAIDQRLIQLGLLPGTEPHTFEVTQNATVSFLQPPQDPATAHDTGITVGTSGSQQATIAATSAAAACGDALLELTDQLNGSDSHVQAAALLRQVLDPDDGMLARLGDLFEAAAEKAKEAAEDDGFDLSHDLADAAVEVRRLGEDLQSAEARMRTLTPLAPPPRSPASPTRTPSLPPRSLPTTPPAAHTLTSSAPWSASGHFAKSPVSSSVRRPPRLCDSPHAGSEPPRCRPGRPRATTPSGPLPGPALATKRRHERPVALSAPNRPWPSPRHQSPS